MSSPVSAELSKLVEGTHFGRGSVPFHTMLTPGFRQIPVLYGQMTHQVWVIDNGKRPPDPDGLWMDDVVSEACRRVFGVSRGQARPRPGSHPTPILEFREFWPDPLVGKVVERVSLLVTDESGASRSEYVRVSCRAVPGADPESVIRAEVYAICKRKFGGGRLTQPSPSIFHFQIMPENSRTCSGAESYVCRYTVLKSGVPHEVMIELPPESGSSWQVAVSQLEKACRKRYGAGKLIYAPDHSETSFEWS